MILQRLAYLSTRKNDEHPVERAKTNYIFSVLSAFFEL